MSTAKIRNQHPTGTRVSESLPRTAFSYRSSSPRSLIRGQARSESTPFNQENHSQWPTKMGDLPLKMSIQIWSEDLAKAHRRRLEILPCEERRQGRCQGLQSLLHQAYFFVGIFRQLWDRPGSTRSSNSTALQRGEQSSHQVGELGAGPRHSMRELPHSHLPELFGQELDRPLGAIWDWRAYFSSALLRNALAPHCCDFGWLISWPSRFTAVPRLGNDDFQNFHLQFREVPGIKNFFFLRHISPWFFRE